MTIYQYRGFGLNINSEIQFPELQFRISGEADINITYGHVYFENVILYPVWKEASIGILANSFYMSVKNVANYQTYENNTIVVEKTNPLVDGRSVRLHVLASVMAFVLLQKNLLPFHASGIIDKKKLILVAGDSGAGKSVSLSHLMKKGYNAFSDDVVVLKNIENVINAIPSYPMIKLWEDSIDVLDDEQFNDRSFYIQPGINKYGFFFHQQFYDEWMPVERIIYVKKADTVQQINHCRLEKIEAFKVLLKNIYRPMLLQDNAVRAMCFRMISILSENCKVIEVTRPLIFDSEKLACYIESLW